MNITITDSLENIRFGYLYVKEFKWVDSTYNEQHGGHPKNGHVYRMAFNKDTNSYRLLYHLGEQANLLFVANLQAKDTDDLMYTSDVDELTRQTILTCDITNEDLDLLCSWIDENNASIRQLMGLQSPGPPTSQEMVKAFKNQTDSEFIEFAKIAKQLKDTNPVWFDGIHNLVLFLKDSTEDSTVSWIQRSKNIGAGKNIGDAIEHLRVYGGDDRRTNFNDLDLMMAIKSLLTELMRNIIHNDN